jgi:hypothetical protein
MPSVLNFNIINIIEPSHACHTHQQTVYFATGHRCPNSNGPNFGLHVSAWQLVVVIDIYVSITVYLP